MTFGERFLRFPELFPARSAGERWGDATVAIDLVGGPYQFHGLLESQAEAMRGRYAGYLTVVAGEAPVGVVLYRVDESEFRPIDTRGWEYTVDLSASPSHLRIAGMNLMARLAVADGAESAIWTNETRGSGFVGVVENVFRPLLAYRLVTSGGLMLHSSGVVVDGAGILFVGRSGAGKSTVARLAIETGREILSDDLNVLVPGPDGWRVGRLPFAGEYPEHGRDGLLPLRAIYRLQKGPAHEVMEMGAARAFAHLLECAPYANVDEHLADALEGVIASVVAAVPTRCLTFRPDPGFWPIIEAR